MTIQRCFALVQERWRTALLASLLVLAAAAAAIWVQTPVYQASSSVFVRTGASGDVFDRTEASDYAVQRITTYADLATSPLVLDPVIESLDLHTDADSLASVLTVQIPEDSLLLTISAEDTDPEQAARIANLVAASLRTEVSGLESASGPSPIHLTTVAPALPSEQPARPDLPLLLGFAALAAVVAGIASALVRGALAALLDTEPDLTVVAQAASGDEVADAVEAHDVDVALLDIEMPGVDGLEALRRIRDRGLDCAVLMVTTFGRPGYLERALAAGARGFVVKDTPAEQLADAVRAVARGERVVDPSLAVDTLAAGPSPLTPREVDVLREALTGASVRAIAGRLHLSAGTVRNHLSAAIGKTATSTRGEAATVARDRGWL